MLSSSFHLHIYIAAAECKYHRNHSDVKLSESTTMNMFQIFFPPSLSLSLCAVKPISLHQTIIFLTSLVLCVLLCRASVLLSELGKDNGFLLLNKPQYKAQKRRVRRSGDNVFVLHYESCERKINPPLFPLSPAHQHFCLYSLPIDKRTGAEKMQLLGVFNQTLSVSETAILSIKVGSRWSVGAVVHNMHAHQQGMELTTQPSFPSSEDSRRF